MHATTEAGFRVKARLLWHHLIMEHGPDGVFKAGDTSAEIAMSLASDMIGSARA